VSRSRGRYKRPFDLALLITSHIMFAPVFLFLWAVIPILIWVDDRGPVFYRQKRVGKDGRVFTVLKFRTMVPDADRLGPAWTTDGDARVTRIGRLLRRTALDELPELLSIWTGDMSIVGPRALDLDEQKWLEVKIDCFIERLKLRPGLTGLAQVYNRTDEAQSKLRYDLEYMERMSPWLDLKLIALSIPNTLLAQWDRRSGKERLQGLDPGSGGHEEPSGLN